MGQKKKQQKPKTNAEAFYDGMLLYSDALSEKNKEALLRQLDFNLYLYEDEKTQLDDHLVNLRLFRSDDRFMHEIARYCHPDVMQLAIDYYGDVNTPNSMGQRPLHAAIMREAEQSENPDELSQQETEKRDMIRLLLENKADLFAKDKFNYSNFHYITKEHPEYYSIVLDVLFPSSKDWTEAQKDTKLRQLVLADYANYKMDTYLVDAPPTDEEVRKITELNTDHDRNGKSLGLRSIPDMLFYVKEKSRRLALIILGPELVQRYGHYTKNGWDLKAHAVSPVELTDMDHDLRTGEIIWDYLSRAIEHKFNNRTDDDKLTEAGNLTRMLTTTNNFIINENLILAATTRLDESIRNKQKYTHNGKLSTVISWEPVIKEPILIGGYWVGEIYDTDQLKEEAAAQKNCLYGYIFKCLFGNKRVFYARKDKDDPESGFSWLVDIEIDPEQMPEDIAKHVFSITSGEALGYRNEDAPNDVQQIPGMVAHFIRRGRWGDLNDLYQEYMEGKKGRDADLDKISILLGSNPLAENAKENRLNDIKKVGNIMRKSLPSIVRKFEPDPKQELDAIMLKYDFLSDIKNIVQLIEFKRPRKPKPYQKKSSAPEIS